MALVTFTSIISYSWKKNLFPFSPFQELTFSSNNSRKPFYQFKKNLKFFKIIQKREKLLSLVEIMFTLPKQLQTIE